MLTEFGGFSNCSVECGQGVQTQERFCVDVNGNPATGCDGELINTRCCVGVEGCIGTIHFKEK